MVIDILQEKHSEGVVLLETDFDDYLATETAECRSFVANIMSQRQLGS